jgi:hypothetical protein
MKISHLTSSGTRLPDFPWMCKKTNEREFLSDQAAAPWGRGRGSCGKRRTAENYTLADIVRWADFRLSALIWQRGQIRMMLATRAPSMRCTSQPLRTASSARGKRWSQNQQRPLPVEQMACSASCTSSTIRSGVLSALKFTSLIADSQ